MLENAESLEQNRWIENSFYLKVKITDFQSIGIDVPEDVQKILHLLK
jgi:3-deoxy-manno-octulosonate cytidylyltransferase (CMP-KDO synthetase)